MLNTKGLNRLKSLYYPKEYSTQNYVFSIYYHPLPTTTQIT